MNQIRFYQTRAGKIRIAAIGLFAGILIAAPVFKQVARAADPMPAAAMAAPTKIAVIDLRKVYVSLVETKETENMLKGMAMELETKKKSHKDQLDEMQLNILHGPKPDSPQHDVMMNEFDKKSMEFLGDEQALQVRASRLRGRQLARAFVAIQKQVAEIAKVRGFDLVLVNQSTELPDNIADVPSQESVTNAIFGRNTIFVSPKIDITEEVTTQVDAAFKAAASAPPTPMTPGK